MILQNVQSKLLAKPATYLI